MDSDNSLFPAGHMIFKRAKCLADLEVHAWNLDRIQLRRGAFISELDAFHTYNVQLGIVRHSIQIAVNGDVPSNAISFVVILNDASIVQHKHTMKKHHLAVLEHGAEIDAVFVEPVSFLSVAINRKLFREQYEGRFLEKYPIEKKFELRVCNAEILDAVKEKLMRILEAVQIKHTFLLLPENMIMLEKTIIDEMLNLVYTSAHEHSESKWIETAESLFKLIKLRYKQDINIESLCRELNISERNAYLTFHKHYAMTPKQYLLSVRLGKIKKILEYSDPKTTQIEHIALQHGFYHMSHFAKIYKSFFGELPSETLWRNKY
ncbi:MAG: helix-turn-helix transcriptional regulator [Sulfuricurvum sp.]|nr:helix-turn-helix transcriptional regulator [Sulfuricurvum sp.]MDP3023545.1 helix-turn-helix transcriptional regulator [Sulfuricurvum sp.]MDP3118880.1 helix-turn-helix transcriptional regulator [Sulfuricurvum sp.]